MLSLNDFTHQRSKLQKDLFDALLRFKKNYQWLWYVIIAEMYLQIMKALS